MNRKTAQIASEIEKAMQALLARGLSDPRVRGLITVTGVDVTDDRRLARVRVSILPEEHQALTMHGLRAATGFLRRRAMGMVRTRSFPQIDFVLDESIKRQTEVLTLIHKASAESENRAGADTAAGDSAADAANHARGSERGSADGGAPGDDRPSSEASW